MAGRSLPHAVLMMIPEPWGGNPDMDPAVRAFYEYHSSLMEPWDGPASIAFTDGTLIGAVLDRNGLRPSRYCITTDDLVIMASEVGVLDIPADRIVVKDRLRPGKMLLDRHRAAAHHQRRGDQARAGGRAAVRRLAAASISSTSRTCRRARAERPDHQTVLRRQQAFGYTQEDLRMLLTPMALGGEEPIGSMGTDTALAVLSDRPRLLYDYFAQLFAQVTNPPLDAIREELVTSMASTIGPEGNLLDARARGLPADQDRVPDPAQRSGREAASPAHRHRRSARRRCRCCYNPDEDGPGLERAMAELCRKASQAVAAGYGILILSDRGVDATHAPIPSLLATAGVHHHLVREGTRTKCGLLVETGDAREVHHVALLLGYGAGAVNPVSGVRDPARPDSPGPAARRHPRPGGDPLHQGAQQGRAEGDVEDGHLDAAELLRRADLRGRRPRPRLRRQVLHLHGVAHRRRRRDGDLGGSATAPRSGRSAAARRAGRARERRRVPVAPRRRGPPLQSRDGVPPAARHAHRPATTSSRSTRGSSTTRASAAPRCAACSG